MVGQVSREGGDGRRIASAPLPPPLPTPPTPPTPGPWYYPSPVPSSVSPYSTPATSPSLPVSRLQRYSPFASNHLQSSTSSTNTGFENSAMQSQPGSLPSNPVAGVPQARTQQLPHILTDFSHSDYVISNRSSMPAPKSERSPVVPPSPQRVYRRGHHKRVSSDLAMSRRGMSPLVSQPPTSQFPEQYHYQTVALPPQTTRAQHSRASQSPEHVTNSHSQPFPHDHTSPDRWQEMQPNHPIMPRDEHRYHRGKNEAGHASYTSSTPDFSQPDHLADNLIARPSPKVDGNFESENRGRSKAWPQPMYLHNSQSFPVVHNFDLDLPKPSPLFMPPARQQSPSRSISSTAASVTSFHRGIQTSNGQPQRSPPRNRTHNERATSAAGSRSSSRVSSRLSSATRRIFGAFSSKTGSRATSRNSDWTESRAGSRAGSKAGSRTASRAGSVDSNDWPEFIADRGPAPAVRESLVPTLGIIAADTDITQRRAGLPAAVVASSGSLPPKELGELQNMGALAYVTSATAGHTDENGMFLTREGDHLGFRFGVIGEVGRGCFGVVLRCRDYKSGRIVAVKVATNSTQELKNQARIEAELLRTLRKTGNPEKHHFVRHISSFTWRNHTCIATEMLGQNLYQILQVNGAMDYESVRYVTRQLAEAVEFLGTQGIIHCDIKPENVLVSDVEQCQVKLIDFGSGCWESKRLYTYIQSRFYRAPEVMLGMTYGPSIDLWSLGCMVGEMLTGRPLFLGEDEIDQINLITQALGVPDHSILTRCLRAGVFFDINRELMRPVAPKSGQFCVPGSRPLSVVLQQWPLALDFCSNVLKWASSDRMSATEAVFHDFCLGI